MLQRRSLRRPSPTCDALRSQFFLLPFLVGAAGLRLFDNSHPWGRLVSMWLCFFYAAPWLVALVLANANTTGRIKRITINAFMIGIGGLGAFIGLFV